MSEELTLEKIEKTLADLKASPVHKCKSFTADEARAYFTPEYNEFWNLKNNDSFAIMAAAVNYEFFYEVDRKFLISCYERLKIEKLKNMLDSSNGRTQVS